jgi:hypothetical protein
LKNRKKKTNCSEHYTNDRLSRLSPYVSSLKYTTLFIETLNSEGMLKSTKITLPTIKVSSRLTSTANDKKSKAKGNDGGYTWVG